jgi:lambda repressor-like predicted transcriptional regulator
MQMDGDPADVVSALRQKTLTMKSLAGAKRKTQVAKYSLVRVVDNDRTRTG